MIGRKIDSDTVYSLFLFFFSRWRRCVWPATCSSVPCCLMVLQSCDQLLCMTEQHFWSCVLRLIISLMDNSANLRHHCCHKFLPSLVALSVHFQAVSATGDVVGEEGYMSGFGLTWFHLGLLVKRYVSSGVQECYRWLCPVGLDTGFSSPSWCWVEKSSCGHVLENLCPISCATVLPIASFTRRMGFCNARWINKKTFEFSDIISFCNLDFLFLVET